MKSAQDLYSFIYKACDHLRGPVGHESFKDYLTPLLYYKRLSDTWDEEFEAALEESGGDMEYARLPEQHLFVIPEGCHWEDVRARDENLGSAIVEALRLIEQANPDTLYGVLSAFSTANFTDKAIISDERFRNLVEHLSKRRLGNKDYSADLMGDAYEILLKKFADESKAKAGEFYTPRPVVKLLVRILDPKPGERVYDPACGSGGMLISCIARCKTRGSTAPHPENWREIKAYGQEQNALTSSVARMNLFLHGVEEFRIINDDTLLRPGFLEAGKLKTFDVVLANPPYSIKQWNRDLFAHDPFGRNFLGLPPQGRADYAFIQHILKSMNPKTGRCAILLPHGVLFREEEKHIRKVLIESDLVEAVIGLAPNLFYNSPMEACVMVCRTKKSKKAKGRILFINAVGEVTRKNAESKLEAWHIEKILKAYRERTSDGVFAYDATLEEIAAKDWSLAISLYAHAASIRSSECGALGLDDAIEEWKHAANQTVDALDDFKLLVEGRQDEET